MLIVRKAKGDDWTPVMGAEVLFAPIDRSMLIRARRAARAVSIADTAEEGAAEAMSAIDMIEEMGDAMSRALITEGVKNWRGVCVMPDDNNEGAGEDLPFSADNLDLVLSDPVIFEAFDAAYVVPFIMREREREEPGNAFVASPNGTGAAAMPVSDTANRRARRKTAAAATRAPTSSKSRKPRPKKPSGAS